MGFLDRLFGETHVPGADGLRVLDVPSIMNLRDLGGYDTPDGPTLARRYLRCGSTRVSSARDRAALRAEGLTHVLDLRGSNEDPRLTCPFSRERGLVWANISLSGQNLSDPALAAAHKSLDYMSRGYLHMLENHEAVRQVMTFLADVPQGECALFHCAAGMDRTGMTALLLLGAVGVSRADIMRDYLYSFASVREVDRFLADGVAPDTLAGRRMRERADIMGATYDALVDAYGSIPAYLRKCGLANDELDRLRRRLLT